MRVEGMFLNSRIARRTFLYFLAAALAPMLLLSALAYQAAQDSFRIAAEREVIETSKSFALRVFERIDTAALVLEGIADRAGGAAAQPDWTVPSALFVNLQPVDGSNPALAAALRSAVRAAGDPGPAADARRRRFRSLLLVLPVAAAGDGPARIFVAQSTPVKQAPWIAGQLRPGYVWGEPDELQAEHPTCVYADQNQRLFCSRRQRADVPPAPASHTLTGAWTLFLGARFAAPSWTFRTWMPRPSVRAQLPELAHFTLWVWLGTMLLVALLSLQVIRRTMVPLEALIAQTRRIPTGPSPSGLRGQDEFGQLATAFDEMGVLVARQLATLNALSDLDHKILKRDDLREIIDVVLARVQHLVPDAVVCVIVEPSATSAWRHVRAVGQDVTQQCPVPMAVSADAPGIPAHANPCAWTALSAGERMTEPSATLLLLGARHGISLHLQIGDRLCGSISLGLAGVDRPSADCLLEVRELGNRIAMAIAAEQRETLLLHQARHDVLTGLPNRFAAQEALAAAIEHASPQQPIAVLFFDLDGFKTINDGLGHASGDRVLVGAANVLSHNVGEVDFVARLGGDEFLVMINDAGSDAEILRGAGRAIAALATPVVIDGVELLIGASVGIAIYPRHGHDVDALIRNADIAMYRAKSAGGQRAVFFEDRMTTEAAERVQWESDLRHAIQAGEIAVHFQPVVDCRTGAIVAAEALARWQHPLRGAIPPATFIPVAERSDLIEALDRCVLHTACREFAAWKRNGHRLARMAVNVSSRQLRSEDFVDTVRSVLAQHHMHGSELEIEITESVLVADLAVAAKRLAAIRDLGVSIAIDDFGTGYSSLAYLKNLPVDTLKIDREFIVDITDSDGALALVRAIVAMGHATGKTLVAEGVEHPAQVELLRSLGCFKIQGYVFHRPMAADALDSLLATDQGVGSGAMAV